MTLVSKTENLIGGTPLFKLGAYCKAHWLCAEIFAKLEYFNPYGSVKDRAVKYMLDEAETRGVLKRGGTVIEPTSGSTGIALAALCAARGYKAVIVMPENMSEERRKLIAAYGAKTVLTDAAEGMHGAIEKAAELCSGLKNAFILGQFKNHANPRAHYETTAREIWADTNGKIDIFVAGVGTGGTLSGVGKYLKEKNPTVKIYAAEPQNSPVLSGGKSGPHKIQGIGAGFVPATFDSSVCDGFINISYQCAKSAVKSLAKTEGILAGISSGAALCAAELVAQRTENKGKIIVTLFPDGGERYLSTDLFD